MPADPERERRSLGDLIRWVPIRVVFMIVAAVVLGLIIDDGEVAIGLLVLLYGLSWLPSLYDAHRRR
ncbi:MAG TPA: hypothetical protein VFR22_13735 [Nocardioidaceae bacterium]|nr:hypothetical protein [Nocardioidaceae bacterium]